MAGVTVPIIPMAHQYLFTEPVEGVHPGLPQLRDPDNLVYFREEVGGLCMGGYERDPAPWALDGIPADFNGKLLAPDMARFEPIMEGAIRRVPAMADAGVNRVINGPEAFTPGQRVHPRRVRGPRVLRGRRLLGPWDRGRRRHRPPDGDLDRGRAARAGPLEDGHPAVRAGLPLAGVHAGALDRELRDLLRHPLPERGAAVGPSAADVAGVSTLLAELGAVVRREVRLGAPELVRVERRGRRRVAPAARAGPASTGRRRSAPRRWRPAGRPPCSTRSSFAKLEVVGPGADARSSQCLCANDVDRPVGSIVYTQLLDRARRHRGRPDGHAARRRVVPARDRDRRRATTTRRWLRQHLPDDGSVAIRDITSSRVCFGLWGPAARDILAPLTRDDVSNEAFPYLTAREITRRVRAGPRAAGHLRRRARLGALRADRVRPGALDDALGRRARRTGSWPAATGRSTRSGSRRATASGRATSPRTRRHSRRGSGSRSRSTSPAGSSAARRWSRRRRPGRASGCAAWSSTTRSPSVSATSRSGSAATSSVASPRGGYGFAVERSIAYAYLPPDAAIGTRGEVEVFGDWIGFEVMREPLWDPAGERIRA